MKTRFTEESLQRSEGFAAHPFCKVSEFQRGATEVSPPPASGIEISVLRFEILNPPRQSANRFSIRAPEQRE
jgi:hypothetical protein